MKRSLERTRASSSEVRETHRTNRQSGFNDSLNKKIKQFIKKKIGCLQNENEMRSIRNRNISRRITEQISEYETNSDNTTEMRGRRSDGVQTDARGGTRSRENVDE